MTMRSFLICFPLTSKAFQWKSLSSAKFWCFWQTHQSQLKDMWHEASQKSVSRTRIFSLFKLQSHKPKCGSKVYCVVGQCNCNLIRQHRESCCFTGLLTFAWWHQVLIVPCNWTICLLCLICVTSLFHPPAMTHILTLSITASARYMCAHLNKLCKIQMVMIIHTSVIQWISFFSPTVVFWALTGEMNDTE